MTRPGSQCWPRWNEFLERLDKWRPCGVEEFGRDGLCIGRTPWEGPHGFLHEIYESLDEAQVQQLEASYEVVFDQSLRGFYRNANGCSLFSILSIGGVVGLVDRLVLRGVRQPVSLDYGNTVERPQGLGATDFIFGGIVGETIVGQLVIGRNGEVRLVHPTRGNDAAVVWQSFDDFLFSEIDRLTEHHNLRGEFTGPPDHRLPPGARRWERM